MATKNYTTRTASLRATIADVRVLDAKKMNLDGKNILEYIEESVPTITHSQDTRETVYENDLWGQWVETKDDGTIVIHDDYLSNPNGSSPWLSNVTKVEDNKAYNGDTVIANIQTEKIKDGTYIFVGDPITYCPLVSFIGDLSSLVNGSYMFYCSLLESFYGDSSGSPVNLSSLMNGYSMFAGTSLTSFNSDLSSLTNGYNMFYDTPLTSFNSDLSNLTNGSYMFYKTSLTSFNSDLSSLVDGKDMFLNAALTSFSGDLSNLVNGYEMFRDTPLTSFSGDLSNLVDGTKMFYTCKLSPQSVMYIIESIRNIAEEKAKYINGEIPWVTYNAFTKKYSAPFGFMQNEIYVHTYDNSNIIIPSSNVGQLTLGIDVTNDSETIEQQLQTFAEGCLCDSWAELKQEFLDKGWTVTFQYGGTTDEIPDEFPNT